MSVSGAMDCWTDPSELFLIPASSLNWCNKGSGMCCPVCQDGACGRSLATGRRDGSS